MPASLCAGMRMRALSLGLSILPRLSARPCATRRLVFPTYGQLLDRVPEFGKVELLRDRAMATCYPGNGARYVRHIDNVSGANRSRVLTCVLYLNDGWVSSDGGGIRVFLRLPPPSPGPEAGTTAVTGSSESFAQRPREEQRDIGPLLDRLVMFWSDARVPHEVLPTAVDRYALSFWYHNGRELAKAVEAERELAADEAKAQMAAENAAADAAQATAAGTAQSS